MAISTTAPPASSPAEIDYPESDGRPMAETDVHIDVITYVREALRAFFADQADVYVSGNLLLYYQEGEPRQCVAPDVFVVRGVPKGQRRTYKLWEEGQVPVWVLEVTSRSTRLEDLGVKRGLYEILGVSEYVLYDPLGEYLDPPFQVLRLRDRRYELVEPNAAGHHPSEALGLELGLEDGQLRLYDPRSGARLPTPAEEAAARRAAEAARQEAEAARQQAEAARQQAEAARQQEQRAREQAEARVAATEAELARLRAELARRGT